MDSKRGEDEAEEQGHADVFSLLVELTGGAIDDDNPDGGDGEAAVSLSARMKRERINQQDEGATVNGAGRTEPPPPPMTKPYVQTLHETFVPLQERQQPPALEPGRVAPGEREISDVVRPPTPRLDEWKSTRRSGKRSKQAQCSGTDAVSTSCDREHSEAATGTRLPRELQSVDEDKPLLQFSSRDDEAAAFATEMEMQSDINVGGAAEERTPTDSLAGAPSEGAVSASFGTEEKHGELTQQRGVEYLMGRHETSSVGTFATNRVEIVPNQENAYPLSPSSHTSRQSEKTAAVEIPSLMSPASTMTFPSVAEEIDKLSEPTAPASLAHLSYSQGEEWVPCMSDSGHTYYYNQLTQECRWQRPQTPELCQEAFNSLLTTDSATQLGHLLQTGLDPNTANRDGVTLLQLAARTGNERAAQVLVEYGATVDWTTESVSATSLLSACQHGHSRIARLLLDYGASSERTDENSNSALHMAAYSQSNDVMRVVLDATGDRLVNHQNVEGETPLHIATKLNNPQAVQTLLTHGASPQLEDALGQSPLILGILENSIECVQLLQNAQLSLPEVNKGDGSYPHVPQTPGSCASTENNETEVDKLLAAIVPAPESCDREILEALRTFADETQRTISALEEELKAKARNEKNYHAQIQSLSSNVQAVNGELEKEKQLRLQVEADAASKASEHEAMRVSLVAAMARCTLLESVVRDAHAKLKQERIERARTDDIVNSRLQQALEENASLLQSLCSLQATRSTDESESRLFVDRSKEHRSSNGPKKKSALPARYATYPDAVNRQGARQYPAYSSFDRHLSEQQAQHEPHPPRHVTFAEPSTTNNKREEVRSGSIAAFHGEMNDMEGQQADRASPSRVEAVWNRFYENLGQAGTTDSAPTQARPRTAATAFDAVRRSDMQCLQSLLLSGSNPNQHSPAEKGTPLHLACELGDLEAVVLLCEFAADVEARDEVGNTPLLAACAQSNFACVQFLLQSAVSLGAANAHGETALHLAAWDGSAECVTILIDYGVDASVPNDFGLTALENVKIRSPMRHKLGDMAPDHPIRRTIQILEEHEAKQNARQEWLFGTAAAPARGEAPARNSDGTDSDAGEDENEDENDISSCSDTELEASSLQSTKYPVLMPPPEVAEALSRAGRR